MSDRIKGAYRASKRIYDDVLTQGSPLSRLYIRLFWGGVDDVAVARRLLERIPDDFEGALLDVPVGTAVFTCDKWSKLTRARVTCLDYSADMLAQAESRLDGCGHVKCVRGDVGSLQMPDGAFDVVFSMNGFHAFPDKDAAFRETHRVLKKGGRFIGCFYIRGELRATDWLVRAVLAPKGWFTPPFETRESLEEKLRGLYSSVELRTDGALVSFDCVK